MAYAMTAMRSAGFADFETPIGTCGIAWGPAGLLGVQLPGGDEARGLQRRPAAEPLGQLGVPPGVRCHRIDEGLPAPAVKERHDGATLGLVTRRQGLRIEARGLHRPLDDRVVETA